MATDGQSRPRRRRIREQSSLVSSERDFGSTAAGTELKETSSFHAITGDETKFKLCKVRSVQFGQKGIPYLNTYDGRTIRYPDPLIKANDTIKLDLESNKIVDFIKFDVGNVVMVTVGRNRGRVGVIKNREKHKGSFETIHVQDAAGHEFATRLGNVFTIGKGTKPWVSLPKGKGIKLSIVEEARKRLAAQNAA
ncbi:40S ribosomal protein S4-like [Hibiscus syriacus]|uniref:40S ribosomal protein S4-like n=1 Tax=Hibiscus syriacus TaxID=106335 RepID=UPI0019208ACA|nr:40S ribosomal protein S4-like [Hibiscus syriacus]